MVALTLVVQKLTDSLNPVESPPVASEIATLRQGRKALPFFVGIPREACNHSPANHLPNPVLCDILPAIFGCSVPSRWLCD